jgi:glycosyltransferase involved in cell wall biosynthesis
MKISYAVTVCNEFMEIQRLLTFLLEHKRDHDEIVVQQDNAGRYNEVYQYLTKQEELGNIKLVLCPLDNDFSKFKNFLNKFCTGDYIFQIDADEIPHEKLIEILPDLLEENIECDVITVPRVNTVEGLTQIHIAKWGWRVNEQGWVNWPDYQWRIYKNKPHINWINKVHERITGHKVWTHLPMIEEFSLYHPKTIEKQEKQNKYYDTL